MYRVLIIEDNMNIAMIERDYLLIEGFEADIVGDGFNGLEKGLEGTYDLILLDLMLPSIDNMKNKCMKKDSGKSFKKFFIVGAILMILSGSVTGVMFRNEIGQLSTSTYNHVVGKYNKKIDGVTSSTVKLGNTARNHDEEDRHEKNKQKEELVNLFIKSSLAAKISLAVSIALVAILFAVYWLGVA